jgi:purine-binding chemotaxis protein CheW
MAATEVLVQEEQLVVFELTDEVYGVDISRVHEIIRMAQITRVPRAPDFVEGVINLRGKVIPVIDLQKRFGLGSGGRSKASRIVVVDVEDNTIGMIVDGVSEVLRLPVSAIEPPSPIVATIDSDYVRGIAKVEERLIILLDLDRILSKQQRSRLEQFVPTGEEVAEAAV